MVEVEGVEVEVLGNNQAEAEAIGAGTIHIELASHPPRQTFFK